MKNIYSWILILISATTVYFLLNYLKPKPPVNELMEARNAITQALTLNTKTYSGEILQQAQALYDSAMDLWLRENERFLYLRKYDLVRGLALQSGEEARKSMLASHESEAVLKQKNQKQIDELSRLLADYQVIYGHVPVDLKSPDLTKIRYLYAEGTLAFEKQNYPEASKKLDTAEIMLKELISVSNENLENYLESYSLWTTIIRETITESRKKSKSCLIVDKYARKCHLYKKGELVDSFSIELGTNWIGDKQYQGDKSTPEGVYTILKRKSSPDTKYYKALLLNYPNEDDKKRFISNKKNGTIDARLAIGGLIEIHGHGGKGIDWTDGCIAVTNEDMDVLYNVCPEGTTVAIAGSLKPFSEIIANRF